MKKYELPVTYDNVVIPGRKFVAKTGRIICSSCVQDNRSVCSDRNNEDWFVVGEISCPVKCDECEYRVSQK